MRADNSDVLYFVIFSDRIFPARQNSTILFELEFRVVMLRVVRLYEFYRDSAGFTHVRAFNIMYFPQRPCFRLISFRAVERYTYITDRYYFLCSVRNLSLSLEHLLPFTFVDILFYTYIRDLCLFTRDQISDSQNISVFEVERIILLILRVDLRNLDTVTILKPRSLKIDFADWVRSDSYCNFTAYPVV